MPLSVRLLSLFLCTGFVVAGGQAAGPAAAAAPGPETARIVTDDLSRFWRAFDAAAGRPTPARAAIFQRDYLDAGSTGLAEFTRLRIGDGTQLAATIDRHPRYYASLRPRMDSVAAFEAPIRAGFRRLAALHPDAVFPDVYLLVGRMNSGGTLGDTGLLIGLEMYGRYPDTPDGELGDWHRAVLRDMDGLPHIVLHELVHYQQHYVLDEAPTLLQMAINEGVADFLGELASGRHINERVHAWAEPRARQLWGEFAAQRHQTSPKGWLYDPAPGQGRPADLGYWVGYRVAKAYYDRAPDKAAAVREMLTIRDFEAFLARSGLGESLGGPQVGAISN
jgi:hypothetical protein